MEDDIEQSEQPEKKRQQRLRSPRAQCQQVIDELSDLAQSPNAKPNNRTDALLRKSELLVELMKISAKEKESEALAENETLKRQHVENSARIAELEAHVSTLKASQSPVRVEVLQDPETPQLKADLAAQVELLTAAAETVRQALSHPERINFAAILITKHGRKAQAFVNQFTDFNALYLANSRTDDQLQETIQAAVVGSRGDAVLTARAVLQARGVPVIESSYTGGSSRFKDEFAPF